MSEKFHFIIARYLGAILTCRCDVFYEFVHFLLFSVRSRTLLQVNEETVENDHYEESNASDILLSKISNLVIQNENYSDSEQERLASENLKNTVKNNIENEHIDNNYQSVIEIDGKNFKSKWRTSYSDEM